MPVRSVTFRRNAGLAVAVLALAACGGDDDGLDDGTGEAGLAEPAVEEVTPVQVVAPPSGCPQVEVLEALHQVTKLVTGSGTTRDVLGRGALGPPQGECEYDFEAETVTVEMAVPVLVQAGPAWAPGQIIDLPYNVWVIDTRRNPPGDVVMRELFSAPFELDSEDGRGAFVEELALTIPLPDGPQSGESFQVLIGFQTR